MDRVLFSLHSKASSFALRTSSARSRSLIEHGVLFVAVCGFGVLILSHISFVYRGETNVYKLSRQTPLACLRSVPQFRKDVDVTHIILTDEEETSCVVPEEAPVDTFLSFSKSQGYLLLSQQDRNRHNITSQIITVSKSDTRCFGEPFLQAIVYNVIGPETVVVNWLLALHQHHGYVYNPRTENVIDLSSSSSNSVLLRHGYHQFIFKFGVIMTSVFLFFITTTLVSFTLRETQDRMLLFTFQLQARIRAQLPHAQLIVTHVVESLVFVPVMVGMMFFLIEFYRGDKLMAFMVLSLVWVCEVFSVVCMRTSPGVHFFPRVFFLLFTLFHIYFFSCPFGFSYTALASTACFLAHSMLFFWHRYELPAVARGLATMQHPRMANAAHPPHAHEQSTAPPFPDVHRADHPNRHPLTMRRHNSGHSFPSVSSAGRGGSVRSSVLFNDGDDGDESYMYFMDGEVVMHRQGHSSSASLEQADSGSIGEPVQDVMSSGVPQDIVAEVGSNGSFDHESVSSEVGTIRRRASARNQVDPPNDRAEVPRSMLNENEIDENLTPRIGTTSRSSQDDGEERDRASRIRNAPMFPFVNFGWRQDA